MQRAAPLHDMTHDNALCLVFAGQKIPFVHRRGPRRDTGIIGVQLREGTADVLLRINREHDVVGSGSLAEIHIVLTDEAAGVIEVVRPEGMQKLMRIGRRRGFVKAAEFHI